MGSLLGGGTSNKSNITALGTKLDPMHYVLTGIFGKNGDVVNNTINQGTQALNHYVGQVTGPLQKFDQSWNPISKAIDNTSLGHAVDQTVSNRPLDAAALVAGGIAGAGALGALGGGADAGAAGANTGLLSAETSAITPTLGSGLGTAADAGSTGILGSAGSSAIPSTFSGLSSGSTSGLSGLFNNASANDYINLAKLLQQNNPNSGYQPQNQNYPYSYTQ